MPGISEGGERGDAGSGGVGGAGGAPNGQSGSGGSAGAETSAAGSPPFVDPFMGTSGCPDGGFPIGRAPCQLSMPLSGGLSTLFKMPDTGCDRGDLSTFSFSPVSDLYQTVIHLAKPLVRGVSGEPLEAAVEIRVKAQTGDWKIWSTPANGCTIRLASNVCWYFEVPDAYYLVSGTGSCSKLAEPQDASDDAVNIGDFWFATIVFP